MFTISKIREIFLIFKKLERRPPPLPRLVAVRLPLKKEEML